MTDQGPNLEELARNAIPPQWVIEMHEHFAATGTYRPEDVQRVLGSTIEPASFRTEQDIRALLKII
jgi:hypothetical protein